MPDCATPNLSYYTQLVSDFHSCQIFHVPTHLFPPHSRPTNTKLVFASESKGLYRGHGSCGRSGQIYEAVRTSATSLCYAPVRETVAMLSCQTQSGYTADSGWHTLYPHDSRDAPYIGRYSEARTNSRMRHYYGLITGSWCIGPRAGLPCRGRVELVTQAAVARRWQGFLVAMMFPPCQGTCGFTLPICMRAERLCSRQPSRFLASA